MNKNKKSLCEIMEDILSFHHRNALQNNPDSLVFAQQTITAVKNFINKYGDKDENNKVSFSR